MGIDGCEAGQSLSHAFAVTQHIALSDIQTGAGPQYRAVFPEQVLSTAVHFSGLMTCVQRQAKSKAAPICQLKRAALLEWQRMMGRLDQCSRRDVEVLVAAGQLHAYLDQRKRELGCEFAGLQAQRRAGFQRSKLGLPVIGGVTAGTRKRKSSPWAGVRHPI